MRKALLVTCAPLLMAGCVVNLSDDHPSGPAEHLTKSIEKGKAESVHVQIKMGAGNLTVGGDATDLMTGDFTYSVPAWKPRIDYSDSGGRGSLTVEQPGDTHGGLNNRKYEWNIKLNNDMPTNLTVQFGAGEGHLDLGKLTLQNLDVEMGVGTLNVDLRGNPHEDYHVHLQGGIGEAKVYLPKQVGVVATVHGGIGSIDTSSLHKEGDRYVNDAYQNNGKAVIRLEVEGGIGAVHLIGG